MQVLAQVLRKAREEKEKKEQEEAEKRQKEEEEMRERMKNMAPPGFKNKIIFYTNKMIIYPDD